MIMDKKNKSTAEAIQWGIPLDEIGKLGERLIQYWDRFHRYFQTRTRDSSAYGLQYLSGLLRMETKRNFTNIGRKV